MDALIRHAEGHPLQVFLLGLLLVGAVGYVDYATGYEVAFSLFYVLPIALVTWFGGRWAGVALACVSAAMWLVADQAAGNRHSHPLIPVWNSGIRLAFFIIITALLTALRNAMRREQALARTDSLTGAMNGRCFYELAEREMDRAARYGRPFTLAYLDLDHFKCVNDRFGHAAGDDALRAVAQHLAANVRRTDAVARLGGDEFGILLPETDPDHAQAVLSKLREAVNAAMREHGWPITVSIGALTCAAPPASTDALVKLADDLMYEVKRDGRDAVRYAVFAG